MSRLDSKEKPEVIAEDRSESPSKNGRGIFGKKRDKVEKPELRQQQKNKASLIHHMESGRKESPQPKRQAAQRKQNMQDKGRTGGNQASGSKGSAKAAPEEASDRSHGTQQSVNTLKQRFENISRRNTEHNERRMTRKERDKHN